MTLPNRFRRTPLGGFRRTALGAFGGAERDPDVFLVEPVSTFRVSIEIDKVEAFTRDSNGDIDTLIKTVAITQRIMMNRHLEHILEIGFMQAALAPSNFMFFNHLGTFRGPIPPATTLVATRAAASNLFGGGPFVQDLSTRAARSVTATQAILSFDTEATHLRQTWLALDASTKILRGYVGFVTGAALALWYWPDSENPDFGPPNSPFGVIFKHFGRIIYESL